MKLETSYKNFVKRSLNWGFRAIAMSGVGWLLACGADDCCDFLLVSWQPDKPMTNQCHLLVTAWQTNVTPPDTLSVNLMCGCQPSFPWSIWTKWSRVHNQKNCLKKIQCAKFPCHWSSKPVHWTSLLWSWSLLLVVFFSRSWSWS